MPVSPIVVGHSRVVVYLVVPRSLFGLGRGNSFLAFLQLDGEKGAVGENDASSFEYVVHAEGSVPELVGHLGEESG